MLLSVVSLQLVLISKVYEKYSEQTQNYIYPCYSYRSSPYSKTFFAADTFWLKF